MGALEVPGAPSGASVASGTGDRVMGLYGGATGGSGCDTGGLWETHDDTAVWTRSKTHDDTGLVLNQKPMMTETPQTSKKFFLEKKVGPRKFFFGIFFLGGFCKPVSSWVLVESNPYVSRRQFRSPAPV